MDLLRRTLIFLILLSPLPIQAQERLPVRVEKVNSSQYYRIDKLSEFSFAYGDRDFVFTNIPPCLNGAYHVITANADKFSRGDFFMMLRADVPLHVYVGHDTRYPARPGWLEKRFRPVSAQLAIGDAKFSSTRVRFQLYLGRFPPGEMVLGGNLSDADKSNFAMYTVILVEAEQDKCRF